MTAAATKPDNIFVDANILRGPTCTYKLFFVIKLQ